MCLIGCKPSGRHIEQHDIFFGIATSPGELVGQMEAFWPDGGKLHLDAWRKVTRVGDVLIEVKERPVIASAATVAGSDLEPVPGPGSRYLYFINMGGYEPGVFEEYHAKLLCVQPDKGGAIKAAKESPFYKQSAQSHIDDQYGVDIDDLYNVEDILASDLKDRYLLDFEDIGPDQLQVYPEDTWVIGYTKLSQLIK